MLYTCAYFADPNEDIETAQTRKLEHVCRKLRLQPGERLIDFGCGWGGFILYAAKHYGVHATGITISKEQAAWVERRIREEGLQDRVTLRFGDYRDAPEDKPFDKASSIGLVEHLGARKVRPFFDKIRRLLKPNGLYLHHGITLKPYTPYPAWRAFTLKYVFPDGELVPINTTIDHLSAAGFEVRDVESLREHYMYTLERWLRKLESNADAVRDLTDDVTYRIYRIYLAGALHGFQWGVYNLYQTLAVNAVEGVTGLPLTRKDWYR